MKIRADCATHGPAADLEPSHACMMMQRVTRNSSNPGQLKQQRKTRLNINSEATQRNKRVKNDHIRQHVQKMLESSVRVGPNCD